MIKVSGLTKIYGDHIAVDDISFEVKEDFKTLIVSNDKVKDGETYSIYVDGSQVK